MITRNGPYKELWCFKCDQSVISIAATPNCSLISATTVGRKLYLLDNNGHPVWKDPIVLDNEGWCTSISKDGNYIAVGTACKNPSEGTIYVFDGHKNLLLSERLSAPVWSASFSRNGDILAVSTWRNKAYRYVRERDIYSLKDEIELPGNGLYGISLSSDGDLCAVAAYDKGIYLLFQDWEDQKYIDYPSGIYNIDYSEVIKKFVAGTRNGNIIIFTEKGLDSISRTISSSPICGIGMTDDGSILSLGSFDGRVYATTANGAILWSLATDGEVWSSGISNDGNMIYIGSGDHTIRLFKNHCNSAALAEIASAELLVKSYVNVTDQNIDYLLSLYIKNGVVEYGAQWLTEAIPSALSRREALARLYYYDIEAHPDHFSSHYGLARILSDKNDLINAAYHYQKAAADPQLQSKALSKAGDCFSSLGLNSATSLCFLRAREQHLDSDAKRVLYNQGRCYEDAGLWKEAAKHYEFLLSWDARYRDVYNRLEEMRHLFDSRYVKKVDWEKSDYTGLTVSLLGPDTPRVNDVDLELVDVIRARAAEVDLSASKQAMYQRIVSDLSNNDDFMKGIIGLGLDYSTEAFLKYDYSLPEDEMKKFMETTNMTYLIGNKEIKTALDIGTATGRYPKLFASKGIIAYGVDIEEKAIEYANSKLKPSLVDRIKLIVGDARDIPLPNDMFDLVTCMMGTFAHIPRRDHSIVLQNIIRVLNPSGLAVISTWDIECEHLSYLSMYNESQKEVIRRNSLSKENAKKLFEVSGFVDVEVCSFCLLPNMVLYGLGIQTLKDQDIQLAVQADLAARAMFNDRHGEMYLVIGKKPATIPGTL